ncbi:MAG: hypothetical protein KDB23_13265, partial [Planctomycetales bacterium]|nr:hypothetical protein [Planctomycetales bacterium]
ALTELRDAWQASNANPTLYEQSEADGDQTQTVLLDTYEEPPITDTLVNPQLAELASQRDDTLTAATTGETDDEDAVDQADWSPEAAPQPDFSQNSLYADEHDDESEAVQPTIEPSAEQSDVQPSSSFSPTDTASILAKFGASLRFEEDEEDEMHETFSSPADAATSMPASTSLGNSPASAQIERHDEDDESSIQSYMADLMRRNGVASGSPVPPAAPKPMPEPPKKSAPKPTPQYTEEDVAPTSLTPRAKLPNINLSAMRDVANSTARRDITQHTVRREREHAMFSWALSAAMLAVGAGLGMLTQQPFSLANWAAAACFVAAVFWASLGLNRWKQVRAAQTVPIDPRQHRDATTVDDDVMSADAAAELPLDEE